MRGLGGLAALLLCGAAPAQPPDSTGPDVEFDAVAARLAAVTTLRGDFEQTREIAVLSRPLSARGRFIISELGLYWEQTEPFRSLTIATGDSLSQGVADRPLETLSTADQPIAAAISELFIGIFKGDRERLGEHFALAFDAEGSAWQLQLEPREYPLTEVIDSIRVEGSAYLDSLEVIGIGGDRMHLRFSNQRPDPPQLSDAERALYAP